MSESIPAKPSSTPHARRRRPSRGRADVPFWLLSAGLHAALICFLLMFAPVREIVFRRERLKEAEVITRGDELEEVIEAIRDKTVERLRARVALLDEGQERMARNFTIINEYFQPFAAEQRATARARMEKYITEVLPRQQELVALITKARDGGDPAVPIAYSQKWMSRILTAQEEVRRGIRLLELGGEELLKRQQEAEDTQLKATQFLRWLGGDLRSMEWHTKRLAELAERRLAEVAKVAAATDEIEAVGWVVECAEVGIAECEASYVLAQEAKDKNLIRATKRDLDRAKRDLSDGKRSLSSAERNHQRASDQVKRTDGDIVKSQESFKKAATNRDSHLTAGGNVQASACARQKAVVETVRQLWKDETEGKQ
jgi:hypothetical protein